MAVVVSPAQGLVFTVLVTAPPLELLEGFLANLLRKTSRLLSSFSVAQAKLAPRLLKTQLCLPLSSSIPDPWTTMSLCRLIPTLARPKITRQPRNLPAVGLWAPAGRLR